MNANIYFKPFSMKYFDEFPMNNEDAHLCFSIYVPAGLSVSFHRR